MKIKPAPDMFNNFTDMNNVNIAFSHPVFIKRILAFIEKLPTSLNVTFRISDRVKRSTDYNVTNKLKNVCFYEEIEVNEYFNNVVAMYSFQRLLKSKFRLLWIKCD